MVLAALVCVGLLVWFVASPKQEAAPGLAPSASRVAPEQPETQVVRPEVPQVPANEIGVKAHEVLATPEAALRRALPTRCDISTCEAHIHGHVETVDGSPIEGALVHFGGGPLFEIDGDVLTTDARGDFTIEVASIPDDHRLHVLVKGYEPAEGYSGLGLRYRRKWRVEQFVLAPLAGYSVPGQVRDGDEQGLVGWIIEPVELTPVDSAYGSNLEDWLFDRAEHDDRPWRVISDGAGEFIISGLRAQTYEFVARDPVRGERLIAETWGRRLEFTSRQGQEFCTVVGSVRDRQGVPVPNADVRFFIGNSEPEIRATTDDAGRFTAEGVPLTCHWVTARCEGFVWWSQQDFEAQAAGAEGQLEIEMEREHQVRLTLGGVPHSKVLVRAKTEEGLLVLGTRVNFTSSSRGSMLVLPLGEATRDGLVMECPGTLSLLIPESASVLEVYAWPPPKYEDSKTLARVISKEESSFERLTWTPLVMSRGVETEVRVHLPR